MYIHFYRMIKVILSVTPKLGIGAEENLLVRIPNDISRFKRLTTGHIVIMGRKTWDSLPKDARPLPDRINIVITNNKEYLSMNTKGMDLYFISMKSFSVLFNKLRKKNPNRIGYVIGGGQIVSEFINHLEPILRPSELLLTELVNYNERKMTKPTVYLKNIPQDYILKDVSQDQEYEKNGVLYRYRYLTYHRLAQYRTSENVYLNGLRKILSLGTSRSDRTNVGTISIFAEQYRFDLQKGFPLLTTKKVPFKSVVEELLWFCRGDTDAKILQEKGVKIWDGNTSRSFLDGRNLNHYPEGVLGPGYGWSWRHYNAEYSPNFSDTSKVDTKVLGGFDQLEYVLNLLKTDPMSRRIYMNYWNPSEMDTTALMPCHLSIQFYVEIEECTGLKYLSGHMYQRSMDTFLGEPWNIASYALLVMILAKKCDMVPKNLIISTGDTHIYSNHIDQVKEQLTRVPRPLPKVILSESIKTKDWHSLKAEDFRLAGYFSYDSIKAPMAV